MRSLVNLTLAFCNLQQSNGFSIHADYLTKHILEMPLQTFDPGQDQLPVSCTGRIYENLTASSLFCTPQKQTNIAHLYRETVVEDPHVNLAGQLW